MGHGDPLHHDPLQMSLIPFWQHYKWITMNIADIDYCQKIFVLYEFEKIIVLLNLSIIYNLKFHTRCPPAPLRWLINWGPSFCRNAAWIASCSACENSVCWHQTFLLLIWKFIWRLELLKNKLVKMPVAVTCPKHVSCCFVFVPATAIGADVLP